MRILITFCMAICLFACKEVSFEQPQPEGKKALASVPKELRGRYLVRTADGELSKDTIIITANGYKFAYYDQLERKAENDQFDIGVLSDSLVLKSYKGYYFVNINDHPEWILRVIKPEKNGDLIYMTLEERDTDFNIYLEKLSSQIRIDSVQTSEETLYQIDPSPQQLVGLIEGGYVSKTTLVKIR